MKIKYEDTGDEIEIAQAGTAFMSTVNAFENLSEEDKQMVLGTTVEYAPHPYIFISPARATSDGLTMVSEGKETPFESLPEWEESKVKSFQWFGLTLLPAATIYRCMAAVYINFTFLMERFLSSKMLERKFTA